MNKLYSLIRNTHCTSTHQRFALDCLPLVQTPQAKNLARWLLQHHRRLLRGAVDPDQRFRDFHNHNIHVDQGSWGGAPRVAHQWYDRLVTYIAMRQYADAAHAFGILSHYLTDVLQPLHTVSNDREALVHLPLESSIRKHYGKIYQRCQRGDFSIHLDLSTQVGWLGGCMLAGAEFAHERCDDLMDHYVFDDGPQSPTAGLTSTSMDLLAELFSLALTTLSQVLERATADAQAIAGHAVKPTAFHRGYFSALSKTPWIAAKNLFQSRFNQYQVNELKREYYRTGTVTQWLPEEVDVKRRVIAIYQQEQQRGQAPKRRSAVRFQLSDQPVAA